MKKLGLLIIMSLFFTQTAFAGISADFNADASKSQNACVVEIDISYVLNSNYDLDSAEVELSSTEASYNKTLTLLNDGSYGLGSATINAPMPDTTKLFNFTARFYMSPENSSVRKLLSTDYGSAICENPTYTQNQQIQKQIQQQNTTNGLSTRLYSAASKNGGSTIQYGNKSFNIGGIGAALSGCLGLGGKLTSALGSLFGSGSNDSVGVDDSKANQKESCGDALAYAASRVLIQNISKSVINWATSGNNGNPYYPTNYQSLYQNIRNTEIRSFVTDLQNNAGANPYNSSFAKSLAAKAREDSKSFAERTTYTGPSQAFFQDFRNGGWDSWFKYILIPKNNPLGYSQIASQEIANNQNTATQSTQEEVRNNNGFLSQKVCDDKGYVAWKDAEEEARVTAAAASGDADAIKRSASAICKNFKVQTPGSLISSQLSTVLNSPLRQAEQVDEVDEALGAVFDSIVASLVNKGLSSLSSNDFKQSVDFSYNAPGSQNPGYILPTGGTFWDQFNTNFDLRRDLPGIIATQKAYLNQVQKNNQALTLVLKSIDRMDYALPGPKIGWADGIPEKVYQTVSDLKHQAQLYQGGIIGNLLSLGMRDKVLDGIESAFTQIFNEIFGQYQSAISATFDPDYNPKMPSTSKDLISRIKTRGAYEEKLSSSISEVDSMKNIISQLESVRTQVDDLYKRACIRFKKDYPDPSAVCI